jgi:hypothetical protein
VLPGTVVLVLMIVMSGCATVPPLEVEDLSGYLPDRDGPYLGFSVPQNRSLVETALETPDARRSRSLSRSDLTRVLDRTNFVLVSLGPGPGGGGSPGNIYAVVEGRFPPAILDMTLRFSRQWVIRRYTRGKTEYTYYQDRYSPVQVASAGPRAVLVSYGAIEKLLPYTGRGSGSWSEPGDADRPAVGFPADLNRDFRAHGGTLYLSSPPADFFDGVGPVRVDIREMRFYLDPDPSHDYGKRPDNGKNGASSAGAGWVLGGLVRLASETEARAFAVVMRLSLGSLLSRRGVPMMQIVRELDVRRDGASVLFSGVQLDRDSVLDLVASFRVPDTR